jgi:hypothetical protein
LRHQQGTEGQGNNLSRTQDSASFCKRASQMQGTMKELLLLVLLQVVTALTCCQQMI